MEAEAAIAKLVFAGSMGAGKTTAISVLADSPPVSTEMPITDAQGGAKTTTTVALDFATTILDDGTPLFLYGLPGQDHFAFMRPIVLEGAIGALILLDGRDQALTEACLEWIRSIHESDPALPIAIGITHTDVSADFSIETIRKLLRAEKRRTPVFTVDARSKEQMVHLVRALLAEGLE